MSREDWNTLNAFGTTDPARIRAMDADRGSVPPSECYAGNKSHDAHELFAPGQRCTHCTYVAPIRARLLLQVEGREPVEVASFEPTPVPGPREEPAAFWRCRGTFLYGDVTKLDAALTVEVRELLKSTEGSEGRK